MRFHLVIVIAACGRTPMMSTPGDASVSDQSSQEVQVDTPLQPCSSGAPDPTFGTGGVTTPPFGNLPAIGSNISEDTSGRIVASGAAIYRSRSTPAVARFLPGGVLDSTFGTAGTLVLEDDTAVDSWFLSHEHLGDERIALVGTHGQTVMLVMLTPNGQLDQAFGLNGVVLPSSANPEQGIALEVDATGRYVVAVQSYESPSSSVGNWHLMRFMPNGNVDLTFGIGGIAASSLPSPTYVYDMIKHENGFFAVGDVDGRNHTDSHSRFHT